MDTSDPSSRDRPVGAILDRLDGLAGDGRLSLADLVHAFGPQGFLPVMMVPALLVVSPLSGIPLFSTACGLTIAVVAAQMVAGRDRLWLPRVLARRGVEGPRARAALRRLQTVAGWLDRHARRRFPLFLRGPFRKWMQVTCLLCGLAMPVLEFVPFSSSILGAAVLLLATALLAGDGLLAILGLAAVAGVALAPLWIFGVI